MRTMVGLLLRLALLLSGRNAARGNACIILGFLFGVYANEKSGRP